RGTAQLQFSAVGSDIMFARGPSWQLEEIAELVRDWETPARNGAGAESAVPYERAILSVQRADPARVAQMMKTLFPETRGPFFAVDGGRLIVRGTAEQIREFTGVLGDVESLVASSTAAAPAELQVFTTGPLKNSNASDTADLLKKLFANDNRAQPFAAE